MIFKRYVLITLLVSSFQANPGVARICQRFPVLNRLIPCENLYHYHVFSSDTQENPQYHDESHLWAVNRLGTGRNFHDLDELPTATAVGGTKYEVRKPRK